jgi:membrane protease subunit HflC
MSKKTKEPKVKAEKERSSIGVTVMKYVIALAVVAVLVWFGFTTQVREGDCAVILRFGAVREEITEAGLYFKLPWPFESVVTYDARLQYLESNRLETTTKDKRNIIIQSYVLWEIEDPVFYHNSVGARGSIDTNIRDQVFSATNSVLGGYDLTSIVSLDKEQIKIDQIQDEIFNRVKENCLKNYGISVTDVSILRLSLPDTNLASVFDQMRQERQTDIDVILAAARLEASNITTEADREAAEIVAQGTTEASKILAEAETEVAKIYAAAQSANLDLYKFLKELDTVIGSVDSRTVLIVKMDEYPFNVLEKYSDSMTSGNEESVLYDLSYILTQLPEDDKKALVNAVGELITAASKVDIPEIAAGES